MTVGARLRLSFAVVAISALGIAASSLLQAYRLEGDARAINLCGSERMRAYRLATLASQYALYRDMVTADEIELEIGRFADVLADLESGDPEAGVKATRSEAGAFALREAGGIFKLFEGQVRALVRAADRTPPPDLRLETQAVVAMATSLADRMDRATAAIEEASASALRRYRDVQLALFFATAVVSLAAFENMRRAILKRLPEIERGLRALGRGQLGTQLHIPPAHGVQDEMAALASSFNDTSAELERARAVILAHEAELARRNEDLRRADRLKSQFLANMSHELRTPLTSVIGFADLMRRGTYGPLVPKQEERLDALLRNARHLLGLIGDLLDLSKIEAGKLDVRFERVAPAVIAADVADALRPAAEAKGLALEVDIAPEVPEVETDPARVRQVLFNLASNAVKFTERGKVRIAVHPGSAPDAVWIEVDDTGPGIAATDLPRLFQRFEQLDGTHTRRHGGTGLGLHISQRLAHLLGGRIEVASQIGRGSRFALVLPGAKKLEEDGTCPAPRNTAPGSSSSTTTRTSSPS